MKDIIHQITGLTTNKKWLAAGLGLAAVIAQALVFSPSDVQGEISPPGNPFTLVGSWEMQIGAPPGPTFTALETFTEGGGSVETDNGPGGRATGIGTWTRTGPRSFLATFMKQQIDGAGNLVLTTKVRRVITLDRNGNEFTGRDNVDLFDPVGNRIPVEIPSSPFRGRRIAAELLTW